jgi:hypothetical protein
MTIVLDTLAEHAPTPATPATIATLVELTTEATLPRLAERLALPVPVLADTARATLVAALRQADGRMRGRAAEILATHAGPEVVAAVEPLALEPDATTRRYAIEILHRACTPSATPTLLRALDDDDWWVRERAVDALGQARAAEAVTPITRLLHRDPRAATACIRALGAIAQPDCVEPLVRLARAEDAAVRDAALRGLRALSEAALESGLAPTRARHARLGSGPARARHARAGARRIPRTTPSQAPLAAASSPTANPVPHVLDTRDLPVGHMLGGRFRILERIGCGGFGTVYRACDRHVNEDVVLKLLAPHLAHDHESRERFVRELRLARRISHPTSSASTTCSNWTVRPRSRWSGSRATISADSSRRRGHCPRHAYARSRDRPSRVWPPRTRWACCIATSSPAISSSAKGTPCASWTSVWPRSSRTPSRA